VRIFTDWHTSAQAEAGLRERLPSQVADQVMDAIEFAQVRHGDQRRPTGVPYLEHLLEALEVLVAGATVTDPEVLVATVLHDVLEDTDTTVAELAERFGPRVAELVGWVTIPKTGPGEDKQAVKRASLRRLTAAPGDALLVKLADRASNVQTLRNLSLDRQRSYYAQTVEYIVPLAAAEPWFAAWYRDWQAAHADLAAGPSALTPPEVVRHEDGETDSESDSSRG
jgi:(p)ppGpp synthase/HD superfamily hydrolase